MSSTPAPKSGKSEHDIESLRRRLEEAEETLRAITSGEVDALVVNTRMGERIFTLQGADTPYRIAVENINEGTLTLSSEGTILYSNNYFAGMVQNDLNKVIGTCFFNFVSPDNREKVNDMLGQESSRAEVSLLSAKDIVIPAFLAIKRIPFEDQVSVCAVVTDLTEQKRSQQVISALKQADQLKDEFIGLVSHELKTPLTVLIGSLAIVRDERVSKEDRNELLQEASSGAETLAGILDNMLELSRFQAGCLRLEKQHVKIDQIAGKVIRRVQQKYDSHYIVLDFPGETPVNVDAVKIEQVLYNLVENAVKYSPPGTEVRVFGQRDKQNFRVGVRDRGIGISPADQRRIFELFTRLPGSGKKGVGLGLVVCKRLVEAHGGRIWVESQPGKGSTFLFTVPCSS